MTRDDVIRMAREAEIIDFRDESDDPHVAQMVDFLERFAALVAAAEREACAVEVEEMECHMRCRFGREAAAAIRARGQA